MSVIVGIDIGGSTTKIVAFDDKKRLIAPLFVSATDPLTSLYGAFGKFTSINSLHLADIERIRITGVGASYINNSIYSLPCETVSEFDCIGTGGLYLSGLEHAIIVSMGTGTALIHAECGNKFTYLGGTGIGGGTLMGLAQNMLGMENIDHIFELASEGNLDNIDLRIKDIATKDTLPQLSEALTASNFGNVSDLATKSDIALGIINMVFETIAMLSIFAARGHNIDNIVLTGNLTSAPQAKNIFDALSAMFHVNFIIPEHARFGTVIGAALSRSC